MVQFKNMLGLREEKLMLLGCIISYTNQCIYTRDIRIPHFEVSGSCRSGLPV